MAQSPDYDSTGIEHFNIPSFTFTNGLKMPVKVAYRLFGDPMSRKRALILTAYGGLINTTLTFTGPHQALAYYLVICVAMLG